MQCVILAGGLGTRMWPHARNVPKTLLPVAGRPFAWWQLDWLARAGVTSIVYCVAYLGEQIQEYVGDGSSWGVDVVYVDEGSELRGTAGAIRLAADHDVLDSRFLVLYGDSWLQINPADVYQHSDSTGLPALMTVYENEGRWDTSNVVFADGLVTRYEKGLDPIPAEMRWIDYGLQVLTRVLVESRIEAGRVSDLAPLFTELAAEGQLAAFEATERFYEIGSPEGLSEASALLATRAANP
jgi:MurNAc alpha-1-phosphate uridylyltransferase